jgi:hypothetical protein
LAKAREDCSALLIAPTSAGTTLAILGAYDPLPRRIDPLNWASGAS